jgi:hypothetical protein
VLCDEKDCRNEDSKREDQSRRPDAAAAGGEVLRVVWAGHLIRTNDARYRFAPQVCLLHEVPLGIPHQARLAAGQVIGIRA